MAKASKKQTEANISISRETLQKKIESKLISRGISDPKAADKRQIYLATVATLKDLMKENRHQFKKRIKASSTKKVCYLCMEFLVGRSLENVSRNLGVYQILSEIYQDYGTDFATVYSCETDPGLGNGGLGRLAACFLDSLSAQDYQATGFSLCYENGLFRQRLLDGEQVELPDTWLEEGGEWLYPRPEKSVSVCFGGQIEERWENGELRITNTEYDEVRAVPYDLMIPGTDTNAVNPLRLWRAKEVNVPIDYSSQGQYIRAMERDKSVAEITRQLYPPDQTDEGKLLRLTQQYFLVSASLQNIISDYFGSYGTLEGFENRIAIHVNDTHPALCIPELMRILMDIYSYSWDNAWRIVTKTVTYTNHTVLPEALECWRVDLFRVRLPRIFAIINEINRRFCADLWEMYPGNWDRISRMAIIGYGQVRMANLCVVGSHTVNGVSALHSDILKKTVFRDFYHMTPWKFTNVTNGIVHRRWLCSANPGLTSLLDDTIGGGFRRDASLLSGFADFAEDKAVLERLNAVKLANKERFAAFTKEKMGRNIDPHSIFDVQAKRMHEYKRQLLNILKILALYQEICANPNADIPPQTFIFGAKAAPGYAMAKQLIKLAYFLGVELENNPLTRDRLKVVFMEEYNVSMAEVLMPAAEISEQISLAGKEASGTGNMKFMMNGALTLGTLDGANVEMLEAVGDQNMYIFGLNTYEVEEMWRHGYDAKEIYHNSGRLRGVIDRMYGKIGGQNFSHIADYLIAGHHGVADPYMCLADFDAYCFTHRKVLQDYANREAWARRSLYNIAYSGRFAADRSIAEYANNIWHTNPVGR
ncbi:MAG: glycogen/starch/alpha-glucan phosphorylase [Clostridia bacterium]|nr:glycogen/starch/alpha-glucan phosphorylase [Clostridia bacterium]